MLDSIIFFELTSISEITQSIKNGHVSTTRCPKRKRIQRIPFQHSPANQRRMVKTKKINISCRKFNSTRTCHICDQNHIFKTRFNLKRHLQNVHNTEKIPCEMRKIPEEFRKCKNCEKSFRHEQSLINYRKLCSKRTFQCIKEPKNASKNNQKRPISRFRSIFNEESNRMLQPVQEHENQPFLTDGVYQKCLKRQKTASEEKISTNQINEKLQAVQVGKKICVICDAEFQNEDELQKHGVVHEVQLNSIELLAVMCEICDTKFDSDDSKKKHVTERHYSSS